MEWIRPYSEKVIFNEKLMLVIRHFDTEKAIWYKQDNADSLRLCCFKKVTFVLQDSQNTT